MAIEDIRNIVKKEKDSEEAIQRAKEEAGRIVEEAKTEAKKIMNDVEDQRYLNGLFETEMKKIEQKKKAVEKEFAVELKNLKKSGEENMEKAIATILKLVLGESEIMENLKSQLDFIKEVEIKEIIDEAKATAAAEIDEARAKIEQIKKKETIEILKKTQETEQRELEAARIEGKRKVLNLKFQLIESAFSGTLAKLKEIVEKESPSYRNHLEDFIIEAAKRLDGWEFELIIGSKDAAFVKKRLKRIEDALSAAKGVVVSLKMSDEPLRSIGGVVVRSSDHREIFNNTLEARVSRVRQENLPEISQILSGSEEQ